MLRKLFSKVKRSTHHRQDVKPPTVDINTLEYDLAKLEDDFNAKQLEYKNMFIELGDLIKKEDMIVRSLEAHIQAMFTGTCTASSITAKTDEYQSRMKDLECLQQRHTDLMKGHHNEMYAFEKQQEYLRGRIDTYSELEYLL